LPDEIIVEASYPNPFNPKTTIRYGVPLSGNVNITISNINGRQIFNHEEPDLDVGYYSFTWDAGKFPSGIYFISIYYKNNLINSQKIILIK